MRLSVWVHCCTGHEEIPPRACAFVLPMVRRLSLYMPVVSGQATPFSHRVKSAISSSTMVMLRKIGAEHDFTASCGEPVAGRASYSGGVIRSCVP